MAKRKVFDLHCDTLDYLGWGLLPDDLRANGAGSISEEAERVPTGTLSDLATSPGHLSLCGMAPISWCQCFAVFIPDTLSVEESRRFFDVISKTAHAHQAAHPDLLEFTRDPAAIEGVLDSGKTAGLLTIENSKLLAASPDMVERIERAGVRMATLTWNAANPLGSGHETHQGLTPFGRSIVAALEARDIVVDVSHLNDEGFSDLVAIARKPFAASHSNARAVCNHPRNLTDDQFRAIRDAGGICGLNFHTAFLSEDTREVTPEDLIKHLEHWMEIGGEDVCALGSDYDGCHAPEWLTPCTRVLDLARLIEDHFGTTLAHKVLYGNAHDFFLRSVG